MKSKARETVKYSSADCLSYFQSVPLQEGNMTSIHTCVDNFTDSKMTSLRNLFYLQVPLHRSSDFHTYIVHCVQYSTYRNEAISLGHMHNKYTSSSPHFVCAFSPNMKVLNPKGNIFKSGRVADYNA